MIIGVPKEIKSAERRVGLTPGSVRELAVHGHEVVVETSAGAGIGASDDDYVAAGARIGTVDEVWDQGELIVKFKESQAVERARLRPEQMLFTYLHLAPDPDQTRGLVDSGATCIAYETVTDARGGLNVCRGAVTEEHVAIALEYDYVEPAEALGIE
jgi:alanine dehydrogenase